ncbi:FoF1 ATP synthase subunit delta [Microseira wollei]|uniref:ATP synthase subunit delta n=2 Tax=Microseira wollei TaxID=467598 RepID=A0AAV3XBF7_9CYAN|nr:F0F1 ATP synthase subunit delta [Microseira wollei NIES-4236]
MKDSAVMAEIVEPYAEALMSVAQAHNLAEAFGNDMRDLLNLLENSPELRDFLASPLIAAENKKAVLEQIVSGVNPLMVNFLRLLVDRRRILFLEGIAKHYLALLRKLNQAVLAEVISAVALSEEQQNAVREKVIAMTGARSVDLDLKTDPDLIGGVIIKVGSQIVDASLRGQLRRISLRLS